jgi:hypothetical protein
MLQLALYSSTYLNQFVSMNQQLAVVTYLCGRNSDPGKSSLKQQLQDVFGVPAIRLLLSHVASADLGWIPNPNLMPQRL